MNDEKVFNLWKAILIDKVGEDTIETFTNQKRLRFFGALSI